MHNEIKNLISESGIIKKARIQSFVISGIGKKSTQL